jgi:putative aldouronate transport system permease protein
MQVSRKSSLTVELFISLFCFACLLPMLAVLSISLSNDSQILEKGYSILPRGFSLDAYRIVFRTQSLANAYGVSALVTACGTVGGLTINSMIAYALSRKDFKLRGLITFLVFFTMLFNGGMVANYILVIKYLHLKNTLFALILPFMVNAWYILLLRTNMQSIPFSIVEAAEIDGASQWQTFSRVVLPLSKTTLATVALFTALQYWNDWFLAMLYTTKNELAPLQYLLYKVTMNFENLERYLSDGGGVIDIKDLPKESARMAICMLAAGPMLVVFPFFQKYFTKGITVGSVKG